MTARTSAPPVSNEVPCLGVSSCLLGERVRYDGNHKRDDYIAGVLGEVFEFRPVCPEMAIGLGVPRPPIHLVGDSEHPRAVGVMDAALDVTEPLQEYGRRMARQLGGKISGYLFKAKSPSCGLTGVPVTRAEDEGSARDGTGLYAREIEAADPLLPVTEEGWLADPAWRAHFAERVFAYHRWQQFLKSGVSAAGLVHFHAIHKYSLMAHGPERLRELGRLVAEADDPPAPATLRRYAERFMEAMARPVTPQTQTNVLQHLAGYLRDRLENSERRALKETIEAYRQGSTDLAEPVRLLRDCFRRHPDDYIQSQVYLFPSAGELWLRYQLRED